MSTSEEYLRQLVAREPMPDWGASVRDVAAERGTGAARYLAGLTGKSVRTAERWIAKATNKVNPRTGRPSQASEPKPGEQVSIAEAVRLARAARRLGAATTVHAGSVEVAYADSGRYEGTRRIGDLPVAGVLGEAVRVAAELLADGDVARASEVLDTGVLEAYGVPEGTLEITDYRDGFSIS